jgi:DNA-binding NtrC family response regulator
MQKLFIVDDEETILKLIRTVIETFFAGQFEIITFESADTAIKALSEDSLPDLVITDNSCPRKGDGCRLVSKVKGLNPEIPTIVISGDVDYRHEIMASGADIFLPKPCGADAIAHAVDSVLQHHSVRR